MITNFKIHQILASSISRKESLDILFKKKKKMHGKENVMSHCSDVARGWAGWALAYPEFGSSVNPIPTGEDRLCPPQFCLPTRI